MTYAELFATNTELRRLDEEVERNAFSSEPKNHPTAQDALLFRAKLVMQKLFPNKGNEINAGLHDKIVYVFMLDALYCQGHKSPALYHHLSVERQYDLMYDGKDATFDKLYSDQTEKFLDFYNKKLEGHPDETYDGGDLWGD